MEIKWHCILFAVFCFVLSRNTLQRDTVDALSWFCVLYIVASKPNKQQSGPPVEFARSFSFYFIFSRLLLLVSNPAHKQWLSLQVAFCSPFDRAWLSHVWADLQQSARRCPTAGQMMRDQALTSNDHGDLLYRIQMGRPYLINSICFLLINSHCPTYIWPPWQLVSTYSECPSSYKKGQDSIFVPSKRGGNVRPAWGREKLRLAMLSSPWYQSCVCVHGLTDQTALFMWPAYKHM